MPESLRIRHPITTAGPFHAIRTYAKNMHVKNTAPTQPSRLIRPILEMEHLQIFAHGPNTRSLSRPSGGRKELIKHKPTPVHEGRPHLQLFCLCRLLNTPREISEVLSLVQPPNLAEADEKRIAADTEKMTLTFGGSLEAH